AIIHLGAGALGVAFATIDRKSVFLLASLSDRRVGGNDIVEALMDAALRDEPVGPVGRAACRRAVEAMKQELAHREHASRIVRYVQDGQEVTRELSIGAAELDAALEVLREPLADLYQEALEEAALEPDEVEV